MNATTTDTRVAAGLCSFCPGATTPATMRATDRTGTERLICADCDWIVANLNWGQLHDRVMEYQLNGDTRPWWMPARLWRRKVNHLESLAGRWTTSLSTLTGRGLTYLKEDHND